MDTDQQGLCYAAVEGVCEDGWPGLGGNKTNANTRLNSKIKVAENNNGACNVETLDFRSWAYPLTPTNTRIELPDNM